MEEFKPIANMDQYFISNTGKIKSLKGKQPRILKTAINNCGYEIVAMPFNKKRKTFYVHRLVAKTFIQSDIKKLTVNHKDGNKLNNNVSNLEVVTYSENAYHAFQTGLKEGTNGESNGMSKLSNEDCINLIHDLLNGKSNKEIGLKYDIHPNYVSLIRHKKRWKHLWRQLERATTIP